MRGNTVSCFVTKDYGLIGDEEVNDSVKVQCLEYELDLILRRLILRVSLTKPDPFFSADLRHDAVARNFFDRQVGTPEKLIEFVKTAHLPKALLATLLIPSTQEIFLRVCAIKEREATDKCGSSGDPCLEDGCAFEGTTQEVCLNAVLLSEGKCLKDCTDIWVGMFGNPENRIDIWKR